MNYLVINYWSCNLYKSLPVLRRIIFLFIYPCRMCKHFLFKSNIRSYRFCQSTIQIDVRKNRINFLILCIGHWINYLFLYSRLFFKKLQLGNRFSKNQEFENWELIRWKRKLRFQKVDKLWQLKAENFKAKIYRKRLIFKQKQLHFWSNIIGWRSYLVNFSPICAIWNFSVILDF